MTTELVELAERPEFTVDEALRIADQNADSYEKVASVSRTLAAEVRRLRALASRAGGVNDSGPVFSGRFIRFDHLAEKLLPVAEVGYNCAGPQNWRMKEAIRAVLCELYPPAAPEPVAVGSNNSTNDEER